MASYRDFMTIENPNELDERSLRRAVSVMASVANKRLKRLEKNKIYYGRVSGEGTISGVKKYGVRGKTYDEVKREFKRVRGYLLDEQSSFNQMYKTYSKFKQRVIEGYRERKGEELTEKQKKDYKKMRKQKASAGMIKERQLTKAEELQAWRKVWDFYNNAVENGEYAPSKYDSTQVRDYVLGTVQLNMIKDEDEQLTDDKIYEKLIDYITSNYESKQSTRQKNDEKDVSTSSLINDTDEEQEDFNYGSSD